MKGEKLSPKEEEFCQQYFHLRNGRRAAIEAGYSEKRAGATACELRAKRNIQERLSELEKEWRESSEVSREQVIAELKAIAFSNIADDLLDSSAENAEPEEGYLPFGQEVLRQLPRKPRYVTASIASIKCSAKGEIEIKRYDKNSALGKLAEIMGLTKPQDVNVNLSISDALNEARERGERSEVVGIE